MLKSHNARRVLRLMRIGSASVAGCVLLLNGVSAAAIDFSRPLQFHITPQQLSTALVEFSRQAGVQFAAPGSGLAEARSGGVSGELRPDAALNELLRDTGFVFRIIDEGTVAITPAGSKTKSSTATASTSGGRNRRLAQVADNPSSAGPAETTGPVASSDTRQSSSTKEDPELNEVLVSGRRIDGLNNKGLLQSGENAALYHEVVTSEEIERLGISSIEELFRYIPQTSSASTSLQAPAGNTQTSGGLSSKASTIGLRGFVSSQTVVLINGRALPRSGVFESGGADLGRIPIAAIERVEVLPYAGSAIYGAGAIGGAINIILRKEFSGHDLSTYIGTTTEGGGDEVRLNYVGGTTFNEGKTNITATLSYQHRSALRAGDRDYLDEALRRYGPDSTAVDGQGVRLFESFMLPAFAAAPGTILVGRAPGEPVNDLGIPGAPGVRFAAIPAGTTPEQALALTPESFAATAGEANLSPRFARSVLYEPVDSYNLNAQWGHRFGDGELEAYGEFALGHNRKDYSTVQQIAIDLSETDPLNPFRTEVTPGFVGRPIKIILDTPDLPDPSVLYEDEYARTVLGLKGRLTKRWQWSADAVFDYAHSSVDSKNPIENLTTLTSLSPFADPGPAAPAGTRRAIYPVLADHSLYPIAAADAGNYFGYVRHSTTHSRQWEGNARVLGTVFELPAGPLQTSLVGKYQYWDFSYGQHFSGSDDWSQLINNAPLDPARSGTPATRKVLQGAVEISIPIISRLWQPLPIESFELQGSFSREKDRSSSVDPDDLPFSDEQSASSSVIAARLQLTRDVAFRGSYSEGFFPPEWSAVGTPINTIMLPGFFPDPRRGNTLQFFEPGAPMMTIQQGGNPDLIPETAESTNIGIMLTPRLLPGFSLNVDYWRIEKVDAVVFTSFVDIISNPDAYGFLITRAPPSAEDVARGWEGFITGVDARAFNAAITRTEGFDVKLRYLLDTPSLGSFDLMAGGSFTDHFDLLATPNSPSVDTAGGSGPLRWRANSSLAWTRRAWSATVTGRYTGWRSTGTTAPSESYPGAFPLDGDRIPDSLRWDIQLGYEIPRGSLGSQGVASWLDGTRFVLGAINVFNEKPAFVSDGFAFYNSAEDPRQRVLYLQVKKTL